MKIEMIDRPRQTGKTSFLKLKVHESAIDYDLVVVLCSNYRQTHELEQYFKKYNFKNVLFDVDIPLGFTGQKILILLDEPFSIDLEKQAKLIESFMIYSMSNTIKVWGIGTRKKSAPKFEDYI